MNKLKQDVSYELQDYVEEFNEAVKYAEDLDSLQDRLHELADSKVDIYYYDLAKWIAEDTNNGFLVDEAIAEYGVESSDFFKLIQLGQYKQHYDRFSELYNLYENEQIEVEA